MQYQVAREELQSPPTLSFWGMLSEAVLMIAAALILTLSVGI